jgi:hypothetical protein
VFIFHPENEQDACSIIAGLLPFLKETASPYFVELFSEEAYVRHVHSKWERKTRQAYSAEEPELYSFLAEMKR